MLPAHEILLSLFDYDSETGQLVRKTGRNAGKPVAVHNGEGKWRYPQIRVLGKTCRYHRAVFLHQNGYLPKCIDHIDGDKLNTRIENLAEISVSDNCRKAPKPPRALPKGVTMNKRRKKFVAMYSRQGKNVYLGAYETAEQASAAYQAAIAS